MKRLIYSLAGLVFLVPLLLNCGGGSSSTQPPSLEFRLQDTVQKTRAKYQLPGLGAQFRDSGGDWIRSVDGVRRLHLMDPIQPGDRFHLGSNAKAMTATMIATLVEAGSLQWDTRPLDVFPELASLVHPGYANITLRQLLCHTAGMPAFTEYEDITALPAFPGDLPAQRAAFTAYLLLQAPAVQPGYAYSNTGYTVAAAMAERVTGQSWESLMESKVFRPLGIAWNTGWPGSDGSPEPWGHWDPDGSGHLVPYDPVNGVPFPGILSPAGNVSMSLADYARFLDFHLQGLAGRDGLLRASTVRELHTPPAGGSYAMGWDVHVSGGVLLEEHDGGGVQFWVYTLLIPSRNYALAVVANSYDARTEQAVAELAARILAIH